MVCVEVTASLEVTVFMHSRETQMFIFGKEQSREDGTGERLKEIYTLYIFLKLCTHTSVFLEVNQSATHQS